MKSQRTTFRTASLIATIAFSVASSDGGTPLATLRYEIVGVQLKASPAMVSVPKGVPGSVLVELVGAQGSTNVAGSSLGEGAYVEAILRGPAFPARRVVGQLNQALLLPPLNLVGDYQLDGIRLVDAVTGATRMEATPGSVPVHVFDEVLVSKVTSRPLTLDEIREKGIVIDEQNFRAVEFEVAFVLEGKTIPIRFPVVSPTFKQSTEIIPTAELEAKLAAAQVINQEIRSSTELPPELQTSGFHIEVQGINLQRVDLEEKDLALQIPPIPALMVIPGNIGYLNQFFSVQIFTENAAPRNSGLNVWNVQAKLVLPPGPDKIPGANYSTPGDDPLRFARVGPDKIINEIQTIVRPGADNQAGTADDVGRLYPGESGQAEFLVEGLQEGLHVMDLDLTADLDGLAAGTVRIKGKAAGSVLVRNPKFSMAFSHPRTIRAGEPYDAFVTILNTSQTIANLASVTLPAAGLRGGVLESDETVQFETILPGQTVTARYRIRSQRTGTISFSNLTTGDDSVQGRFRLSMGIDERGVILSPDTILMPDYVNFLPASLVNAANRVLGQALSVSTAPQLPPSVKPVARNIVTRRVLELAEAGQRIRYGDSLSRVLSDLLLDWQGARNFSEGFDQIMRETDAGSEFRAALMNEWEGGDALNAAARLVDRASDLAGRGESWHLAASGETNVEIALIQGETSVTPEQSGIRQSLAYRGNRGHFLAAVPSTNANRLIRWQTREAVASADLVAILVQSNGIAQRFTWTLTNPPPGSCYHFVPADSSGMLNADLNCDGINEFSFAATRVEVTEAPPSLVTVFQDTTVQAGRPAGACVGDGSILNYGTVLSVLYSKPMTSNTVNNPTAYRFEDGNAGGSVQIQPGGRVALINMRNSFSALRPRTLTISGVTDPRGNPISNPVRPVISTLTQGISLRGRVVRVDSSPAIGVPVTLTMHDGTDGGDGCVPVDVRVAQVFTDANGYFLFDFILYGVPYTVAATDTSGLSPELVTQLLNSSADAFSRENLLQLASQSNNELLAEFTGGRLPGAIAAVEGVDRAILRDVIPVGSPRVGSEVPVALRFRGRGTVLGQVLSADGVIPAAQVAVNLFPDPDSRELGRGLFTDNNGRFAFNGVPRGRFSIKAQREEEPARTFIGELSQLGQITDVVIILNAANTNVTRTGMRGRVFETDNVTPHSRARVFVGHVNNTSLGDLVAAVDADDEGFWSADGIPLGTWDVLAISFDGKRKAIRGGIGAIAGVISHVNLTLQGLATVSGRVETSAGVPVTDAMVAGGEALVRTDANGLFTLTGVPTGSRSLSAGVERSPTNGPAKSNPAFDFPKFGSATLNVLPGADNFVLIRLGSAGRIIGRVLDANGNPVPNARVSMPFGLGFRWVNADAQGQYRFEGMALGDYTMSAPSPPAQDTDTAGLLSALRDGSEEEIQAAIGEAFAIFTGAGDPYLNGEGASFNPGSWGYTHTRINFDGQTVVADIRFLREGTIAGTVLNGQGVPIGARLRLTGLGPLANGAPGVVIRGERNSDPALGTFAFNGQLLVGDWTLQAASPFYPVVLTQSGRTSSIDTDETNVVLQFPLVREVEGRLTGTIFNPDATHAGSGVQVKIGLGSDYVLTTDTNGFFDTQIKIPAGSYTLEVNDPASGLVAISSANVSAGIVNVANVTLLGKGGLSVRVFKGDGTPATNAAVEITQGSYPRDHFEGTTDAGGVVQFSNIFEGHYAVSAQMQTGPARVFGRTSAIVSRGQTDAVRIDLTPTGTIRGVFVKADLVTPISFAQVAIGDIGFATTGTNGLFEVGGIPLGTYRLTAKDAVTGRLGINTTTLNFDGEIKEVNLVEQIQFRGEIFGKVLDIFGTGVVAGAAVTLNSSDPLGGPRTMTTGSDGRFSFPDALPGPFSLTAIDPETQFPTSKSATLPDRTSSFEIDILLQPVASISGIIYQPDGTTPATNTTVDFNGLVFDTDLSGRVSFTRLRLGDYLLRANSRAPGQTRSVGETNILIAAPGVAPGFTLVLRGVGSVNGQVFESDRVTPVVGAEVRLDLQSPPFQGQSESKFTDLTGHYSFENIPIGNYRLVAQSLALAASFSGVISNHFETNLVDLYLGDNGAITGQLVRRDGTTPVSGADVLFTFTSQSGNPGRAVGRADSSGVFLVENIPVGTFNLEAVASQFDGIAFRSGTLSGNGQVLNLGAVPFDEDDPRVLSLVPPNGAAGVPITTSIELVFNEALAPGTVTYSGMYLRSPSGIVPGSVQLFPDPTNGILNRVRIIPNNPLVSLTTYEIIGIDGERRNASGTITGLGVTDLVGRPLVTPFVSSFTTADNDPPVLVSIFPSNNAVQIDPRAVMRLSFSEPIRDSNYAFTVIGPGGPVAGTRSVGLNGLVLTFTPTAALEVNAIHTLSVSNVSDLAGNAAVGQPFIATFTTLDTLGPVIATLRIADNRPPIAGGTVPVEALLTVDEPSVSVRFTRNLEPAGLATHAPYRANVSLPSQGSATVRAIATDRYGNDGPLAELVINVVSNQPPIARLLRGTPAGGPVGSGETFTVLVSATDDYSVTNLSIVASGAFSHYTNFFSGTQRTLTFVVPTGATPGSALRFRAQATDGLGALSEEVVLDLEIVDRTPPQLVIQTPANNAMLNLPQPLNLVVVSSDNSANHLLELALSGALTGTQTRNVVASPNSPTTNTFVVSLVNAPTNGASLTATVRATDGTSNVTTVVHTFRLPDLRPPRLISANPTNQSVRQSLWLDEVAFNFDEPLDPATATNNSVVVTNNAGVGVPFTVSLANGNQRLLVALQRPLVPGVTYTNTLLPGLADTSSNAWQNVGGAVVPSEGARFIFTTADILGVTPTNGTRIVPGQHLAAAVNFEPGLGAGFFRFRMNSNTPLDVPVSGSSSNAGAILQLETDAATATLAIEAHRSGEPHYAVGEVSLSVRPRNGDDDSDGMANGFEVDFNFNPFDPADAGSDADGDTLSNLQEHNLGTSPVNRDTDGDGLRDDVDPEPLNPEDALSPVILTFDLNGISNAQNVNPNYGDRVTDNVMGTFSYGGLDPSAPNVALSYPSGAPSLWTTGYGSLTNVLYERNVDGTGILAVKMAADPGFLIHLHRFDLAAYTTAFSSDPAITNVQVLDYTGNVLFSTNNVRISRTNFTQFTFSPPLSDNALTIRANALNLGNLNNDIAIDNIRFSQSGAAPCGPAGLVAAWPAEGSGLDAVGTNHAILQNGVAFAPGRIGNAFDFDGVNDYVEVPSSAELRLSNELTVAGWINLRALNAGAIAVKGIDAEAPLDWALTVGGDGRLRTHLNRGGVWHYFDGNTAMSTGTWHHVAMVYDGATLKAYVNGQLDGSQPGTGNIQASEGSVRLGAYAPVNGFFSKAFFSGAIDELSVYGRALGSDEIASIAAGGASGVCPPNQDTDGDGMPDRFELLHRLNPHVDDRSRDPDNDGLTNLAEFNGGTFPRDPDTDDDGLPDGADPSPLLPNQAPVPGAGPAGKALALDGVDDLVNLGTWFDYQTFTMGMWIKSGANQATYADIVDNNHTGGRGWVAQYQNFGNTYVWGAGPTSDILFNLIPNEWQYLVITRDSNHVNKVYLDGLLIGSANGSGPIHYDGSQFFRIGSWGGGGRHWNGIVDRLAVWTTAHTADQIYLSSQIAGTEPALAGYWDFNEGTGLLAADSSTNNRTGTLGGGNINAAPAWVGGLDITSLTLTGSVLHVAITLAGTDPEGDPVTAIITKLPSRGRLYQTSDGIARGAPITNAPTVVIDPARRVLYAPPRAVSTFEQFHFKLTDGLAQSESAIRILKVVADPGSDLDGDGMPDSFEVAHQFDPEANDALLDADADGLTNFQEFQRGTLPRDSDTDNDGLNDGLEVALNTDPLDADTDDDGLIDSVDPFPLAATTGVEFSGATALTITEGQTTNVILQIGSGSAPLLMVDHPATNMPPTFAAIVSFLPVNTSSNGTATMILRLNPLHDASGSYTVTIRGLAANGNTGVHHLTITVQDDPTLLVSRWKDPVNGNWNDPARWTDGVPTSNHVAVIDVEGSYIVNLNSEINAIGLAVNHSNAVASVTQPITIQSPLELRAGTLNVNANATPTFNGGLVNEGHIVVRSLSGGNETHLRGSGLFNRGVLEVQHTDGGGVKRFYAPVRNEAGGTFQINESAVVDIQEGGHWTVAGGTFSLGTNALLRLVDGSPPGERLLLADAAILQGVGRIEVYQQNILDLGSRTSVPYAVWMMHANAQLVTGGSHFEVRTGDRLQGFVGAPVMVPGGAEYTQQDSTSWSNVVSVANGGKLNLNGATTHTFNGGLINEGYIVVRSVSGGNETHLRGAGITNRGILEVQHTAATGVKRFFVPVRNEAGGTFQINDEVILDLHDGANFTVAAGTFSLGTNAVLRLVDGSPPGERLLLVDAATLQGAGRIEVYNQNILDLGNRTSVPYAIWLMHPSAQLVTGGSHFEVRTGDRLQGIVGAPVVIGTGVEYTQIANMTWSNRVSVVNGGTLNLNGALTHTFDAGLVNEGHVVVRSVSGGNETHLRGVGITNLGLFEVQHTAGSGVKRFFVPLRNEAGGTFQINDEVIMDLQDGANFTIAGGAFSLGTNAVLRLVDGSPPGERLLLADAAILQGTGRIEVYNQNVLDLGNRTSVPYAVWLMHPNAELVTGGSRFEVRAADRLQGIIGAPIVVADGVEYTQQDGTTWSNRVSVSNGGKLNLNGALTHTFTGGLLNEGHVVVRSVGSGNETHLRGVGVTNRGIFEVQHTLGASAKRFFLPVRNEAGGTFQINDNTLLHLEAGADLTVAGGAFFLGSDAVLRLMDGSNPPETLALADAAILQGSGRIEVYNQNILNVGSRTSLPYAVWMMHATAQLVTAGSHFEVRTGDRLQGIVGAPMVVLNGVEYTQVDNSTWSNRVSVANGGKLNLNGALTHTFTGGLLNEGHVVVRSVAGGNETHLRGVGITNLGLFEVQHTAETGPKRFFVPMRNETGGTLQINNDTLIHLEAGADLTLTGGTLDLATNAVLRFADGAPTGERLTLGAGVILQGAGTIHFQNNNELVLEANVNFGELKLIFDGTSTIAGNFSLANSNGGSITFNHSMTVPGSVAIGGDLTVGGVTMTVTINGTLTLETAGVINNPGTLQVGVFVNNGGTLNGNAPIVIGGAAPLQIGGIQLLGPQPGSLQKAQAALPPREVFIRWSGPTRQGFVIETSADLARWKEASAIITEIAPGAYQGRLAMPVEAQQFFRVRLVPRDPPERGFDRPYHPL